VSPADLLRVSRYSSGEPFFGRAGANRFDDYRHPKKKRFGTCYLGLTLATAFAETVLHDEMPVRGRFQIASDVLESRFVVQFGGDSLRVADLTGAALKALGADGSLSTVIPYDLPQRWSVAVHRHPEKVDGMLYVSRHMNTQKAVVLFDRAGGKISAIQYTPLPDFPGALRVVMNFRVAPI
jgi:hypothetical protein